MKIGFLGNANNYPFILARALQRLGQEIVFILMGVLFSTWNYRHMESVSSAIPYSPNHLGQMFLIGRASAISVQHSEVAPVSETPCITYELWVQKYNQGSNARNNSYHTVLREQKGLENLSLQTPTGTVQIKPETFKFTHPALEDKQFLNKDFEQPHTLIALKHRHISTRIMGLKEGIKVKESLIQAGDEITVIGQHTSTNNLPVLEAAIISDQPIEQIVKDSKINLGIGLAIFLFGCGFLVAAFCFAL